LIKIEKVIDLVKNAGEAVLKVYSKQNPRIYHKKDSSPVTEADYLSEKILFSGLQIYGWRILSEETKDDLSRLNKEKIWIIDPLDGTRDFLNKTGEFSVMVALVDKRKPFLGVVYKPVDDKIYFAVKGEGAFLKEKDKALKRLKVSEISSLSEARLVFTRSHLNEMEKKFIQNLKTRRITFMGSVGVKLGEIAEGKADGYISISNKTSQWDICAPEIILKEAGGVVTDLSGGEFIYNRKEINNDNGIVASNGKIHFQMLKKLHQILPERREHK